MPNDKMSNLSIYGFLQASTNIAFQHKLSDMVNLY